MQQLLDDLLDFARSGRAEMPTELLDCRRVVDSVVAGLGTAIARSGGRVIVDDLPHDVVSSRLVLTQVLHNLIANALKFARPGTPPLVRISARTADGAITFRVADNGLGVEKGQEQRVFEPFTRLHSRDRFEGNGIGLAICRRLVERLGGRIWLEPQPSGSVFCVELPQ